MIARFRLSENGELSFLGASRKYEQLPNGAGFCIDGVQVETNGYSGKEEDQAVFVCSDYQEKVVRGDKILVIRGT